MACCVLLTKIASARRAKLSSHNAVNEVPKSHLCFRMFSFSSEKDCYRKRVEETEISQDQAQVRLWLYFREISHTIPTRQLASEIILDLTRVFVNIHYNNSTYRHTYKCSGCFIFITSLRHPWVWQQNKPIGAVEISQVLIHVHFVFLLGESLASRYSRNTDQRLHASFSSGEFGRLKPKDMSSPLVSDHSDSARRVISPIRRRSDDDVSIAPCLIRWNICLLRFMITGCGVASLQTLSGIRYAFLPHELVGDESVSNPEESLRGRLVVARVYSRIKSCKNLVSFTRNLAVKPAL